MPELPEITHLAEQMHTHLTGKTILNLNVLNPKCLNLPPEEFQAAVSGATLEGTHARGKWIFTRTTCGWLLLNLNMGGEVLLVTPTDLPEKRRLVLDFSDGTCLSLNFWWMGFLHHVALDGLASHTSTAKLGPNALEISEQDFTHRLQGKRGTLKAFLLDQAALAGIGNAYVHDILFLAHLHPLRKIESLTAQDVSNLFLAIHAGLEPSLKKGGAFYEVDLFGHKGGFTMEDILIGYKQDQPCPVCATPIIKIKTGSTSSFICPNCQPE